MVMHRRHFSVSTQVHTAGWFAFIKLCTLTGLHLLNCAHWLVCIYQIVHFDSKIFPPKLHFAAAETTFDFAERAAPARPFIHLQQKRKFTKIICNACRYNRVQ